MSRSLRRLIVALAGLGLCATIGACGTVASQTVSESLPCVLHTSVLLSASELPAGFTAEGRGTSSAGSRFYSESGVNEYPGFVGSAIATFQRVVDGSAADTAGSDHADQIAEEVDDWGTVANAKRGSQPPSDPNNDIPDYGNGVGRAVDVPLLGDSTFVYQLDPGAPYGWQPFTGPFVGHVYTNIHVRQGDVSYSIAIDTQGPSLDAVSLAESLAKSAMANDALQCG